MAYDVKEYSDAGHGFLNEHSGFAGRALARIGARFHEPSADDARARILTFFRRYLH